MIAAARFREGTRLNARRGGIASAGPVFVFGQPRFERGQATRRARARLSLRRNIRRVTANTRKQQWFRAVSLRASPYRQCSSRPPSTPAIPPPATRGRELDSNGRFFLSQDERFCWFWAHVCSNKCELKSQIIFSRTLVLDGLGARQGIVAIWMADLRPTRDFRLRGKNVAGQVDWRVRTFFQERSVLAQLSRYAYVRILVHIASL